MFAISKEGYVRFPIKKPLANGCYGAYKKLKFVDKLNNVFVKITIYSLI
jgi:hypothetical protein